MIEELTPTGIPIDDIPAMPAVAARVMNLLAQPEVRQDQLANVIASDSGLTAKVLQIANSPFYGFSRKITTVKDAVVLLGLTAIKGLVITTATRNIYKNPGLLENLLWEHSVGTGIAARLLASRLKACDPDEAFVGGLIHDIGKSVINNSNRLEYLKLYQRAYNENLSGKLYVEWERKIFGFSHLSIGEQVAMKWNLSADLGDCLHRHQVDDEQMLSEANNPPLLAVVAQANTLNHFLGIGMREPDEDEPVLKNLAAEYLKLDAGTIQKVIDEFDAIFDSQKEIFSIK